MKSQCHADEVTPLRAGGNGGWDPDAEHHPDLECPQPAGYCGYEGTRRTMPMTDLIRFPDALRPAWVYNDDPARGMAPAEFLTGSEWGDWEGQLMVGIMSANQLWRLTINGQDNSTRQVEIAGNQRGNPFTPTRFRGLTLAPDNSLYVVDEGTDGSSIYRVVADSDGGGAPTPAPAPADAPPPPSGGPSTQPESGSGDAPSGAGGDDDAALGGKQSAAVGAVLALAAALALLAL